MQNDRTALIAITAAFQALEAAGVGREVKDEKRGTFALARTGGLAPERAGVSLGTGIGGISSALRSTLHQALARPKESLRELRGRLGDAGALEALEAIERRLQAPSRANPFAVAMTMPNTATSALSIKLSLVGPQSTHCAACASGTVAIGHAYRSIATGDLDLVLAGGVEFLDDDYGAIFHSFDLAHTLTKGEDPQRANRPFDRARSGFLFSQGGGAVLVLEEMERAQERGAPILAEGRRLCRDLGRSQHHGHGARGPADRPRHRGGAGRRGSTAGRDRLCQRPRHGHRRQRRDRDRRPVADLRLPAAGELQPSRCSATPWERAARSRRR